MKTKNILIALAAVIAAAMTASCNREEQSAAPEQSSDMSTAPITMTPATAGLETKAAIDGTVFPDARTFHLSAYYNAADETASENYFTDITYAKISGETYWGATPAKYWPFGGTLDLFAVSYDDLTPTSTTYATKVSDGVTLVVPDNSTTQTDILHGSLQTQSKSSEPVAMSFRHAESLLCFVAKSDVAYDETTNLGITIEEIAVEDAYFGGKVVITAAEDNTNGYCTWSDLTDKKEGVSGGIGGIKLLNNANDPISDTLSYNVPAEYMNISADGNHMGIGGVGIIVPEQAAAKVTIKYTMHNGKDASSANIDNTGLLYSFDLSGTSITQWIEGKKNVYKIYFKPKEITITPSVVDWVVTESEKEI